MSSPFTPSDKIKMISEFSVTAVCIVLGAIVGQLATWLAWTVPVMLTVSLAVALLFLLTPLAGKVKAFARSKAESYYYGI